MSSKNSPDHVIERSFHALGTANNIRIFGRDDERPMDLAYARIMEIEDRMSAFKRGSDVWALNSNAGVAPVRLHDDTFDLLKRAVAFSRLSDGAFDCTIRPLVELWGIGIKKNYIPSVQEITEKMALVCYKDIVFDDGAMSAELTEKGQAIDLGGIAKGYAADEVKRVLAGCGIESALINLGGNIVALGGRPDGQPWRIGIQNPLVAAGEYLAVVSVVDKAVVTSGSYERYFIEEGVRYHHILDPRAGRPAQSGLLSVTVVCGNSTDADALATALFVLGCDNGMELLKNFGGKAVFIDEELQITASEGMTNNFEKLG